MSAPACSSDKTANESNSLGSDVVRDGTTTTVALNEFLRIEADDWGWVGGHNLRDAGGPSGCPAADAVEAVHLECRQHRRRPTRVTRSILTKQQGQTFLLVFSTFENCEALARLHQPDGVHAERCRLAEASRVPASPSP